MLRKVLLASILAFGTGMSGARADGETGGGVRVIQGAASAEVRRNRLAPWHKLGAAVVPAGQELRCEEACRVKVDGDNVLTLSPGAVISVGLFFHVPLGPRDTLISAHQVELRGGRIDALSPGPRAMPLVVSAFGTSHVALRGGDVQMVIHGDELAVQVTDGAVRAGANRKWIGLEKGQAVTLPSHGGPSVTEPALGAPEWTADCSGIALLGDDRTAELACCWKPTARAESYVVELARDPRFSTVETAESSSKPSWSKSLPAGRYFLRARAIGADGLAGPYSAPRSLAAIAVKVPPGSTIDAASRTFTLPQGRSVELGDASGLETALDGGAFFPASPFIVMDGAPSHVVHLRFKDDPGSTGSVVVRRRALVADVAFSPKLAHWPEDPIDIKVTLSDATGAVDPSQISPKIHVLVGLTEVSLPWTHNGRVWSARLAPRNVAPTVLRVIAEDEFGTPIGRNFVEIDQGRAAVVAPADNSYMAQR